MPFNAYSIHFLSSTESFESQGAIDTQDLITQEMNILRTYLMTWQSTYVGAAQNAMHYNF